MKAPFRWFGGKWNMTHLIVNVLPEHKTYVEVFGGSGAVLLRKWPAALEVYNDIDSGLVDFFRMIRDPAKLEKLIWQLRITPYSREEWRYCRDNWKLQKRGSIERIRQWYVVAQQSFSGKFGASWSHDKIPAGRAEFLGQSVKSWLNKIENLPEVANRLRLVQIEQLDWYELVKKYDGPDTAFYLDPPYVRETRTSVGKSGEYDREFSDEDHEKLLEWCLDECRGRLLLSGYDNPLYDRLQEEEGWHSSRHQIPLSTPKVKGKREKRTETLWYNYDPATMGASSAQARLFLP